MEQSNKLGYLALGLAGVLLVIILAWFFFGRSQIISPLPEEGIRVIFESPKP